MTLLAKKVLALSGGIGGAKLALGLYHELKPGYLTVLANTGDDFEHFGLSISPDIDTLMYTLAGINNKQQGWGREDESWSFMQAITQLGGETWFNLGDRDLAINVLRTARLKQGEALSSITSELCDELNIHAHIIPMSNDPVRTIVKTENNDLAFQEYFVRDQCQSPVFGFRFDGVDNAKPNMELINQIRQNYFDCIVICPSNPYISIDPILSVPGYRQAIMDCNTPVICVSPIVGNDSVKGPTAKMMREMSITVSSMSICKHYHGLIDGIVVDVTDGLCVGDAEPPVFKTRTLMETLEHKKQLAMDVLGFSESLN